MKLFLITLFVGFAAAASLQNTYLPPNSAQTSGGHGSFLQGPHQSRPNQQYLPPGGQASASFSHGSFAGGHGGQSALGSGGFGGGHGGQGGFGGGHGGQGGFGSGHGGQGGFGGSHGGQGGFGGGHGGHGGIAGGHGGSSFGSQGSYSGGGGGGGSYGGHGSGQQIPILKYENSPNHGDGSYQFEYATGNGITQQEQGHLNNPGSDYAEQVVQGSYSYTGDDGQTYTVHYKADANGFQATGDHLPTPPPIPEAIQKSLAYNAAHAGSGGSGSYGGGSSGGFGGGSSGSFGGGQYQQHQSGGGRPQQQYLPPSRPSFNQNSGYQY